MPFIYYFGLTEEGGRKALDLRIVICSSILLGLDIFLLWLLVNLLFIGLG